MRRPFLFVLAAVASLLATATVAVSATPPTAPATDSMTLDYQGHRVELVRTDDYGVPHVYAGDVQALFFGAGYATAQDRLWQAELFRRSGSGTLAEIDPSAVGADLEIRRHDYTDAEYQQIWEALPSHVKRVFRGYVDGLNAYIAEAKGDPATLLPAEFFSLSGDGTPVFPDEWTVQDVLEGAVFFVRRFGETGGADIQNAALLQAAGPAMFEDLRWHDDPDAYPTNPGTGRATPGNASGFARAWSGPDLEAAAATARSRQEAFVEGLQQVGVPHKGGSNAWAVAPWKAEGRQTLLLGGPQMGYTIPQITHEIGLHGAGFDTEGMTFAGVSPFPLIGRGKSFAWTSTTGVGDTVDHVIELLPSDYELPPGVTDAPDDLSEPMPYVFEGEVRHTDVHQEVVHVRGGTDRTIWVHRTVHGPVVAVDPSQDMAVSVQRVHWMKELETIEAFLGFNLARNAKQFEEAAGKIWTNHNFVYNDRRGTIGYWMVGRKPIFPPGADTRLPRRGDGSQEWQGFEEIVPMTAATNVAQGFLVNWNNKPVPVWDNGDMGAAFGPTHRVGVLAEALRADDAVSFEDMNRLNQVGGYTDIDAFFFVPFLLRSADVVDPSLAAGTAEAIALLEDWQADGLRRTDAAPDDGMYDHPGLSIFHAWFDAMRAEVLAPAPAGGRDPAADAVLWRLFKEDEDHEGDAALPTRFPWLGGEDVDAIAMRVLGEVVTAHGGDLSTWLTAERTTRYTPLGALPAVSHPYLNRGTYNQIVSFTRSGSRSVNVYAPGQSGFVPITAVLGGADLLDLQHVADQLDLYATWTYKDQILDPRRPIGQPDHR